jgi:hypothetical protein
MIHREIRRAKWRGAIVLGLNVPAFILVGFIAWDVGAAGWCCASPVLVVLGLILLSCVMSMVTPVFHPLMQQLKPFGEPREVAKRIDAELKDAEHSTFIGPNRSLTAWGMLNTRRISVSRHWVVALSPSAPAVVFLPDVVWVYKLLVAGRNPLRGPVHPGVCCHIRNGGFAWFLTESELDADRLLTAIADRHPEILTGFRAEWNDLAKASPTALAGEVERRRIVVMNLTPEDREKWIDDRSMELNDFVRRVDSSSQVGKLV